MTSRCGYVALLGRANAGKSTLLNALVGQKIAGVSAKPQTTRHKILGIVTSGEAQILFLDTPGLHRKFDKLAINRFMNQEAWSSLADANLLLYLVDAGAGWHEEDEALFQAVCDQSKVPVLVGLSKVDRVKSQQWQRTAVQVKEALTRLGWPRPSEHVRPSERSEESSFFTISAKRPASVQNLLEQLKGRLPEGPFLYDPEQLTDRPEKFLLQELIRENIFRKLGAELPYQIAVRIDKVSDSADTQSIYATIIVARDSQKGIVLGKRGSKIKEIGIASRESLQRHYGKKVFLDLQVTVDENWLANQERLLAYLNLEP